MRARKTANDGQHQQPAALTAHTPSGAGRTGAVKEVKTRRAQPRTRRVQRKRSRRTSFFDNEKECSRLQEDMEGGDDPWAGMGMDDNEEVLPEELSQDANRLGQDPE